MVYKILARIWAMRPQVDINKPLASNGLTQVQTTNFIGNFPCITFYPPNLPMKENSQEKVSVLGTHNVEHIGKVHTNMAHGKCTQVMPCLLQRVYTQLREGLCHVRFGPHRDWTHGPIYDVKTEPGWAQF